MKKLYLAIGLKKKQDCCEVKSDVFLANSEMEATGTLVNYMDKVCPYNNGWESLMNKVFEVRSELIEQAYLELHPDKTVA